MSSEVDRRIVLRRLGLATCALVIAPPMVTSARADDDEDRGQEGIFQGRRNDDDEDRRRGGILQGRRRDEDDDGGEQGGISQGRRDDDDD